MIQVRRAAAWLPVWALPRLLVHAGLAGIAGIATGDLAVTTVVALALAHVPVGALRTEPTLPPSPRPAVA